MKYAFVTVTDYNFFPGTVATINSVLNYHPSATVVVVQNHKLPLSTPQERMLSSNPQVRLISSQDFEKNLRYVNAWELKSYVSLEAAQEFDAVIGIDSDCLLCSTVDDQIVRALKSGLFIGGKDGSGSDYGSDYDIYGIKTPAHNKQYMSTSLYFCSTTAENKAILRRWADCCNNAIFNGQGAFPGHGDQGVLNAILFASNLSIKVELLENELWSQHWVFWDSIIDFRDGNFINKTAEGRTQRAFHCGGAEKFWVKEHRERVLDNNPLQIYPYIWFLSQFWFGACRDWTIDPFQYLPPRSHHLVEDLFSFLTQIMTVYPESQAIWNQISDPMINRALNDIPRALSLGGGSMTELIDLVAHNPSVHRFVEIGSYEGGSILTIALRFANRDIDFYSVESFMGNLNGSMDGHRLPSRRRYLRNISRFPLARITPVPGDSFHNARFFDDKSIDFLFIDGCHDTEAVLSDIDRWLPKVSRNGIIAGDDFGWESVRIAVLKRFPDVQKTSSGSLWWTKVEK